MKFGDYVGVVDFCLELSSSTSKYKKLIVGSENNAKSYEQWFDRCQSELQFIPYLQSTRLLFSIKLGPRMCDTQSQI